MFIVRYVKQSSLDFAIQLRDGVPLTFDEMEKMKDSVRVETEGAAIRLVELLRKDGCLASYSEVSE